jgi:hypothetical protein
MSPVSHPCGVEVVTTTGEVADVDEIATDDGISARRAWARPL